MFIVQFKCFPFSLHFNIFPTLPAVSLSHLHTSCSFSSSSGRFILFVEVQPSGGRGRVCSEELSEDETIQQLCLKIIWKHQRFTVNSGEGCYPNILGPAAGPHKALWVALGVYILCEDQSSSHIGRKKCSVIVHGQKLNRFQVSMHVDSNKPVKPTVSVLDDFNLEEFTSHWNSIIHQFLVFSHLNFAYNQPK